MRDYTCRCCGTLPPQGISPALINLLASMDAAACQELEISCAYRCPEHNAEVGGVPNSEHVQGCAADVIVPDGMTVDQLADIAEQCGADGVGRYYDQDFVHVDTRGYAARWTDHD